MPASLHAARLLFCTVCREKAKGATFFEAHDGEAIRPMLDVAWAPLLGAFSVLFEEYEDEYFVGLCLEGFIRWGWVGVMLSCVCVGWAWRLLHAARW